VRTEAIARIGLIQNGLPPTNHFSSQKTRLNDLSYDITIFTDLSAILSQITCLTDGQTDGWMDRQNSHHMHAAR